MGTMLPDAVAPLRCPVCWEPLSFLGAPRAALACPRGHSYDAAKQGYFNLLTGKGTAFEADSAEMVAARHDFLTAGHYALLQEAVASLAAASLSDAGAVVLDAGTGTGHYLRAVLDRSPGAAAVGMDISKFALRRAARLNPEAVNVVCDIWQPLPLAGASVDVVMVVFAPRNATEFARILRPGGMVLIVTPQPGHLGEIAELTGMLGIEENKEQRLAESMAGNFTLEGARDLDIALQLDPAAVADIAFMGPAGHHLDRAALHSSTASRSLTEATARFRISAFRHRTS